MAKDFFSDVDFKSSVTLTSTDAGSAAAPELKLYRNSASPADADYLGQIKFQGENDNDQKVVYAKITAKISDASDTTEDGIIEIAHQKAGSNNISARFTSDALKLINGTGLEVADGLLTLGSTAVTSTAAELNILDGVTASTAELNILDGVTSTTAELNILDGCIANSGGLNALASITFGAVAANKAVTADANLDVASFRNVTLTGELDAATLDISGDADIDGTTNLDDVDIDGTVQIDGAVTVGVDDTGVDVKFFGATSGKYMLWDESADSLIVKDTVDAVNFKVNGGQGSDGQVLTSTGSGVAWEAAGGSPAGSNTQVQFNNSGSFGADADFCFDGTRLLLKNNDDVDLDAVSGSLITGGDGTGQHLAYNGNEITSKSDATTAGILYFNPDGGSVRTGTNTALTDFTIKGPLIVGEDDTGHDVKFFGATSGAYLLWDESADKLLTAGGAVVDIVKDKLLIGGTAVTTTAAELNTLDNVTAGTVSASKAVIADSNSDVSSAGHFVAQTGGADGGIVLGRAYGDYVGLRTAGMAEDSGDEYIIMSNGNHTFISAGGGTGNDEGDVYIRGGGNDSSCEIFLDTSENEVHITGQFGVPDGSVSAPAITFTSDKDSGIYLTSEDNSGGSTVPVVAIATGGTIRATFGDDIADFKNAKITTSDVIDINEVRADNGSATDPSFTFTDDGDTGWYRYGANSLARSVGGNEVWYCSDAGNNVFKTHSNATAYNYFLAGGAANSIIYMGDTGSNTTMGGIYTTGSGYFYTRAGSGWRTRQSSSEFRPYTDSAMTLGSSASRWVQLYADTATISTSDVNKKKDIVDTTLGLDFIKALRPVSYKWKKTDGGKDGVRDHQGFIAQEVKTILDAQSGTDASSQALWVDFSVTGEEEQLPDHDDPEKMVTYPAPTDQALRYEELIAPMVKAIQELEARVAAIE